MRSAAMIVVQFHLTHPPPCLVSVYIHPCWRIVCVDVSFDVDEQVLLRNDQDAWYS